MNIERLFRKFGRNISSVNKKGTILTTEKCFVQPLRYKNKMYIEGTPTEIGINESAYYLFLAPAGFDIDSTSDGGYLTDGTDSYHIDRFEKIYLGDKVYFIWAVIRRRYPDTHLTYK